MDFPVEATVLLNNFPDETQVRKILRSHGFELRDLSRDEVSVKGSFLNLKAAKASLELLLKSQTKPDIAPPSPSPVPTASSGAISKYYTSNSSDRNRSRPGSRKQASPTTITTNTTTTTTSFSSSNHHPTSYSPRPDQQRGSLRSGKESFVVDADVFEYAERLRKKDIDCILESHNVRIELRPVGESCSITLHGKSARTAVFKLQSLLHDLNKSLRTQEVSLRDMDRDGKAMLATIQENRNIWKAVLVRQKKDGLHLIGPSGESYELKQRLLGRPVDHSGQRGRTLDRNSRGRSSSLPPINRRNTERESAAVAYPSPAGAAGYTPSKYQDGKREGAESKRGPAAALKRVFRGRSFSETRHKNTADRPNGNAQEMENKSPTLKSPKKGAKQFLIAISPDNIKTAFKNRKKWR